MENLTNMLQKKKVILTLSRLFPVAHPKAGEPTRFKENLIMGYKKHTIRQGCTNNWDKRYQDIKDGKKYLSVREWLGRPYNSEQNEIMRFPMIGLQHIKITPGDSNALVDGKLVPLEEVAKNDCLSTEDFLNWFSTADGSPFTGVIIHFTKLRY